MIIPDLNLLLYAYDSTSPHHETARDWWVACLNGLEPVGLPRVIVFGFVRLATSARVFSSPLTVKEARQVIGSWLERPNVEELDGGRHHVAHTLDLLVDIRAGGNLVTDAQIAAIALEHGATVFTNDTDFARFPGVQVENPLST